MIQLRQIFSGVLLATIAFVVLLGARPLPVDTIAAGYALVLAAIALTAMTSALGDDRHRAPSRFEHELARTHVPPTRPSELVRMERELTLGSSSATHFHLRLRPMLWEIATARLERTPTRPDLGDDAWELLRPERESPQDRAAAGLPLRRLRALLDTLERL